VAKIGQFMVMKNKILCPRAIDI